jgi:Tol biopolymer transport system component
VDAAGGVDFGADLYVVDADGSNQKEVLHHARVGEAIRNPVWLSANELLVNVRGRGQGGFPDLRIELLDLTTGVRRRLVNDAVEVALSPDRKKIAYVSVDKDDQREQLTVADLHTAQIHPLTPDTSPLVFITSIVWSPDGSTVAFASADPTTGAAPDSGGTRTFALHPTLQDLWVVKPDGSDLHRLAELAESQPSLAWAEDSASIYAVGVGGFWRVDTASGTLELIGQGIPFGQIRLFKD